MANGIRQTNTGVVITTSGVAQTVVSTSETLTWETATEWSNAQSQSLVTHLQPAGSDWSATDTIQLVPAQAMGQTDSSVELYYPADEDSGTTANDVSGNGRDGSITGATVGAGGVLGTTEYSFDGDDYIETNWSGVGGSTNRSIECWVNTSTNDDHRIIAYGDPNTSGAKFEFRIDEASTAGDYVVRAEVAGGFIRGTTHVTDGTWHHIGCSLDGTNVTDVDLFVDGSVETVDDSSSQAINTDATNGDPIWIGQRPSSWSGAGLGSIQGTFGEFRFKSAAMSSAEFATHALNDTPTGSLVTAAKQSGAGLPSQLTTTTALNGGSIDVVVHQDTDKDGVSDNSETVSLAGGTDETTSLSSANFTDSADANYWVDFQPSVTAAADAAPTCSKMAVTVS